MFNVAESSIPNNNRPTMKRNLPRSSRYHGERLTPRTLPRDLYRHATDYVYMQVSCFNLSDSSSDAQPPTARYTPYCTGKGNPAPTDQPPTHPPEGVALKEIRRHPARGPHEAFKRSTRRPLGLRGGVGFHGRRRIGGVRDVAAARALARGEVCTLHSLG